MGMRSSEVHIQGRIIDIEVRYLFGHGYDCIDTYVGHCHTSRDRIALYAKFEDGWVSVSWRSD